MERSIIIIGGGLAGLTAAIHLAREGFNIKVFEKDGYPRHKVCGEYVSQEVLPYLRKLGVNLYEMSPPEIERLTFSTKTGERIESKLPLGGLGLSRFALDYFLYENAFSYDNVNVIKDRILNVKYTDGLFTVKTKKDSYKSQVVLGAFGKRSNLDKGLKRNFMTKKTHWMAVKSHYANDGFPEDLVALHNFDGGYCGLSKTESGAVNVCYLTTTKRFKAQKNPVDFKNKVLCENPNLKSFFDKSKNLFKRDLSIAQISFARKSAVKDHILMLGDAAGLIHPLCGNGMAMAIHSAKLASEAIVRFWGHKSLQRKSMEEMYTQSWNTDFKTRIRTGRFLQYILMKPNLAGVSQKLLRTYPALLPKFIEKTHGPANL